MFRLKLRKKFVRLKIEENRTTYVKQSNYCVNMLHREKKKISWKLNINSPITDDNLF